MLRYETFITTQCLLKNKRRGHVEQTDTKHVKLYNCARPQNHKKQLSLKFTIGNTFKAFTTNQFSVSSD